LPPELSFERAAMAEPLSVAVHAVNRLQLRLGETAVVFGAGIIGLLAIQALRAAGCGRLFAVDIRQQRLELAQRLGADSALCAQGANVSADIRRLTGGAGADAAIEAVGVPQTVTQAINSVRKGGRVALVGNVSPQAELPLQAVVTREVALLGCCASAGEYPACLEMIARGRIDVDPLLSAVAPLAEGAQWFQRLRDPKEKLLKVVLVP